MNAIANGRPPRGVRNNNPGNIEANAVTWEGLMPISQMTADQRAENRFCVFSAPKWGFRALALLLMHDGARGCDTVRKIIGRYAPPNENATDAYMRDVSEMIGAEPDVELSLSDRATLVKFCRAIAVHENGGWFFDTQDLEAGVGMALGFPTIPGASGPKEIS